MALNKGNRGNVSGPLEAVFPLPAGGSTINVTATHNRGRKPLLVLWSLFCITPDHGYSAGDEISLQSAYYQGALPTIWSNEAQIGLVLSSANNNIEINNRLTGAAVATLTYTSWQIKVKALWI